MLETLGQDAQCKSLSTSDGFVTILAIGKNARKVGHLTDPPTVLFSLQLNGQLHGVVGHGLKLIGRRASA